MPPGNSTRSLRVRAALLAATLVFATLGTAGPVAAASDIDIELAVGRAIAGSVTAGGIPMVNVNLDACPPATPFGGPDCVGTQTDGAGQFRLAALPPGLWLVRVAPPEIADDAGYLPDVAGGFYAEGTVTPSPADADRVSTQSADQTLAIDLPPGGHVAGFIQAAGGAVADATVSACTVSILACYPGITDASGAFDIPALEGGDYILRVDAPPGADLQSGWVASDGIAPDDEAADAFVVVLGTTTPVDATLPVGRHVAGTITGPDGPLPGAEVSACVLPDGYPCYSATTAADGGYTIAGLSRVSYVIRVTAQGGGLPAVFFRSDGSSGNFREGTPVDLTPGDASGIDVDVPAGATLSGTVILPGGEPAEFVAVQACIASCDDASFSAETDANGSYSIGPVPPGSYVVDARAAGDLLGGYYAAAGLVESESEAQLIPLGEGAAITLDIGLEEAGAIAGTVEGVDGAPVTGDVSACRADVCQYERVDGGAFRLQGLRPGTYVVGFEIESAAGRLKGFHSSGGLVRTAAAATPVVIEATGDETIAVILPAELASIAGTVTHAGVGPIRDARVAACASPDDCAVVDTAADGSYVIGGLWPDEYTVRVIGDGDFLTAWYSTGGPVTDASLASLVVVGDTGGGSGNTSPGTEVSVSPADPTTGTSPATVTFSTVTGAGQTALTISMSGPGGPHGYARGDPPVSFDLSTTAAYTGTVRVCVDYGRVAFRGEESFLRLLQTSAGGWIDVTTSQDAAIDEICGATSSLSSFIVATRTYPFAGFLAPVANPPTVNPVRRGAQVDLRFSLGANAGANIFAQDSPLTYQVDCVSLQRIGPRSTPTFRLSFDPRRTRYTIRWRTDRAWAGQCREFELVLRDGSVHAARFSFRR